MEQNSELLNSIYQNARMGEESLKTLLKSVDNDRLKSDLQTQMAGYANLYSQAEQNMASHHLEPKDLNGLSKASAYLGVKMNTLIDRTPSHVAEMLIQGSTMGVVDITENINKSPSADQSIKDLAKQVLDFENQNIERLKSYL